MTMESPPRALLKLEALALSYLKESHPADFMQRLVFMRGMDWGMVLIKNGCFTRAEIAAVKKFNENVTADFSWYPGISENELNVYNMIEDELYYKLAAPSDNREEDFIRSYVFIIEPPEDNISSLTTTSDIGCRKALRVHRRSRTSPSPNGDTW